MSTPILNPLLSVTGSQPIDRPSAQFDWYLLQKFLGLNIATLGTDPEGNGADPTGNQDSTAAIQFILDHQVQSNNYAVLYIRPNARYLISSPLTFKDGTLTFIYGGGILQLATGANCDMLQSGPNGGILRVNDITFSGSVGSLSAIKLTSGGLHRMTGCIFTGWDGNGINIIPPTGKSVVEVEILSCEFNSNATDINLDATNGPISQVRIVSCNFSSVNPLTTTPFPPAIGFPEFSTRACAGISSTKIYDSNFFWTPPQALAYQTVPQTISSGVQTVLTFGSGFDREGVWVSGSPTRFTAKVDGTYLATAQVSYSIVPTPTAFSVLGLLLNGAFTLPIVAVSNQLQHTIQVTAPQLIMAFGDYIEFVVQHSAVGSATTLANSTFGSLQLQRIP